MNARKLFIVLLLLGTGSVGYFYTGSSPDRQQTPTSNETPNQPAVEKEHRTNQAPSESSGSTEREGQEPSARGDKGSTEYRSRRARVLRAYDGDSLKVRFRDNNQTAEIRLMGIDCPETSEKVDKCGPGGLVDLSCKEQIPLGIRAKSYAKTLLEDEVVTLESYNDFERGNYGRVLAYVRTPDGEDYGLKTIKKGYCNDSGRIYDHPRDEKYERHQRPLRK